MLAAGYSTRRRDRPIGGKSSQANRDRQSVMVPVDVYCKHMDADKGELCRFCVAVPPVTEGSPEKKVVV